MKIGATIPDIMVTGADGSPVGLADPAGGRVVYFYPKADTAGCTREALEFSAALPEFAKAGVTVIAVSKDPPAKLAKFAAKYDLAVPLASDDGRACQAFGTWGEKILYGRKYMGIERATFLFGRDGRLARAWRKVRVPGHVDEVLAAAREL